MLLSLINFKFMLRWCVYAKYEVDLGFISPTHIMQDVQCFPNTLSWEYTDTIL